MPTNNISNAPMAFAPFLALAEREKRAREKKHIDLEDPRKKNPITKGDLSNYGKKNIKNIDEDLVREITEKGIKAGRDPYTLLAMATQETGLGTSGTSGNINPFHLNLDMEPSTSRSSKQIRSNYIDKSIEFMNEKGRLANSLGKTEDADRLQSWNGYGTVWGDKPMYGMHADSMKQRTNLNRWQIDGVKEYGIDMKENPVYGKQVLSIRDSVVKQSPEIVDIVEGYNPSRDLKVFNKGGTLYKMMK